MTNRISLDDTWELLPVDGFRQGYYPLDESGWATQELPAHWQQHPLFACYSGKMVYRRRFALEQLETGGLRLAPETSLKTQNLRIWLRLNGTFYWSQPYFNGVDLGRHEGYFTPQEHEITRWVAAENELLVEVECPDEHDQADKRLITGVFSHWDCIDPQTNPGGIWQPVELLATGTTRIKALLLDSQHVSDTLAQIRFRTTLDAAQAGTATLRWTIAPKNFAGEVQVVTQERQLAQGSHEIDGSLMIRDPQLWWTHDLGAPNCYTVTLDIQHGGATSDTHAATFGIRRFELQNWIAQLNGVRLLIKGSNYAPGDTRIARVTQADCERDLRLARDCHMNLLRVHAHVDTPALYEAADITGVLLWQDFPLQWHYQRAVLPEAERQARAMVRQLYNHPSVAIWCMHNEAVSTTNTSDERPLTKVRQYSSAFGWNWNRAVLDTRLKAVAEAEDQTRPVVRSSGEYAVPGVRAGTDTHFYYGWYPLYGKLRSWEAVVKRFPANIRFVTEFGAQSFPNRESCLKFMHGDIAQIDWKYLAARHQFQPEIMAAWLDWRSAASLEALIDMTQRYQCALNRFYIDRLRFHKYKPTGGIVPFMFHDPNPAILWSVLDYWRVPKRSYDALRLAFSPQYAFTLIDADSYPVGARVTLPIYLVNDAQRETQVSLSARLSGVDGNEIAQVAHRVTLPADCRPIEVERLRLTPERAGAYTLALAWECNGETLAQEYEIRIV